MAWDYIPEISVGNETVPTLRRFMNRGNIKDQSNVNSFHIYKNGDHNSVISFHDFTSKLCVNI